MLPPERTGKSELPLTRNFPGVPQSSLTRRPPHTNSLRTAARRHHRFWKIIRRLLAGVFLLSCLTVGTILGSFYWKSDLARLVLNSLIRHPITFLRERDPLAEFTVARQLPPEKQHVVHVLLLGCDKDYDPRKPVPIKNSRGRSDAILLCRVDFDRQTIHALSIPRDTAVTFPTDNRLHKINAAHALGGPLLTIDVIQHAFGIPIDYYATIDFDGFQKVVDAIGGIELHVPKAMKYDDNWGNLHIDLKPGFQRLNGYQAMGYVRMRHDDNDLARAERQQQFLEALRNRVKDPRNFLKLPDVLDAIMASIQTNMTQGQMLALGNFARQVPRENIHLATLPVDPGRSFVYVNVPASTRLIQQMFFPDGLTPVQINAPARTRVATRQSHSTRRNRRARMAPARKEPEEAADAAAEAPEAPTPPVVPESSAPSELPPAPPAGSEEPSGTGNAFLQAGGQA
ncbi:MAG: LCP family protein [Chloroherpetonaceae bacterium]|nr:LCP family protein [Chthonomonadaceae bacterium]MDW8207413.1 LCP family protein [Chloroherpetonaceae bacterium]